MRKILYHPPYLLRILAFGGGFVTLMFSFVKYIIPLDYRDRAISYPRRMNKTVHDIIESPI